MRTRLPCGHGLAMKVGDRCMACDNERLIGERDTIQAQCEGLREAVEHHRATSPRSTSKQDVRLYEALDQIGGSGG